MSKDRELKIIIKADGSVAVNEIKVVAQSTDELEKQLKEARLEMARLEGEFDKVISKTKGADTEINKLKTDSAALKNENKQLSSELQKMQSALTEATNRVRSLEGQLTSATARIKSVEDELEAAAKDVKTFKNSWSDLATGVNQALDILGKVNRYVGQGWEIAKQGAQLSAARDAFDDYSRSVGKSSEEILTKLNKASGGTIDNMNLIKSASLAMSLGVTQDATKMANLLEIARNKARLFGITTQQAFEDIVTGIGRASPKILDNLGIRIPAAFEEMTDGMSDTEKVAKLFELTLEEGNNQLRAMGGLSNTTADDLAAFDSSVKNLKDNFGILLAEAFGPFVDSLRMDVIPAIGDTMKEVRDTAQALAGFNIEVDRLFKRQGLPGQYGEKMRGIDELKLERKRLGEALSDPISIVKSGFDQEYDLGIKFESSDSEIRKVLQDRIRAINIELKQMEREFEQVKAKMLAETAFNGLEQDLQSDQAALDILDRLAIEIEATDKKTKRASTGVKSLEVDFANLGTSAIRDLDLIGDGFDQFADDMDKVLEDFGDGLDDIENFYGKFYDISADISAVLTNGGKNWRNDLAGLTPASAATGMMDFVTGGLFSASEKGDAKSVIKDIKTPLTKTIAEAVSAGFANADFSNLELTLGNVLSSILTKTVAQSNPVLDAAGSINFGNLGLNLAASAVSSVLTRPGRFFGGREEHGKEAISQASDLKGRMNEAWVDSYASEIMSVYATRAMKDAIASARHGYDRASVGYSWSDSGDGIFSDRTRTYALVDQGASAALEKLTKAMEAAEEYSKNVELSLQLQSAQGYEYKVLQEQIAAYEQSLAKVYSGTAELKWGDGTTSSKAELTEMTYEIKTALAEMTREFASATAERSTKAAMGFMQYAPWLEHIMTPLPDIGNLPPGVKVDRLPGTTGIYADVSRLSRDDYYNAFETLQNNFADRKIDPSLLGMVKESGQAKFDLESMQINDPEAYNEQYLNYLDRQVSAYEEVMERQAEIFNNESKSYEERVAALENYETSLEAYHQAKLDKLRLEKAQEEEEAQLMAEQRQARMESALSVYGEMSQRGDKVVILGGGDANAALEEMMAEFADNPEVMAVLKKVQETNNAKARWG